MTETYITCYVHPEECDGGGSTVQKLMCTYAIAKRLGIKFVQTEMVIDKHNRGDMTPEEWNYNWNRLIPFPNFQNYTGQTFLNFYGEFNELHNLVHGNVVNIVNHSSKRFVDLDVSMIEDVRQDLQKMYNSVKRPELYYDKTRINIAMHVRRFTETDTCTYHVRKLFGSTEKNDSYYYENIRLLKSIFMKRSETNGLTFHIYSEGDEKIFAKFLEFEEEGCEVKLHVRENVFTSIHHMINADVFVASVSSLSYIVHILRDKTTIAHKEQIHRFLPDTKYNLSNSDEMLAIQKIKSFWNKQPCNLLHSFLPIGTKEYFDAVEARKYFVESHIPAFADFAKWKGKKVLEIGCGLGTESINFARAGAILTIIELSDRSIEYCKQRFQIYGLTATFICGNAEELTKFIHDEFDLVWSFGVIHHTSQPSKIVQEIRSVLKSDGELRIMLYSKISYKLFSIMHETNQWQMKNAPSLIANYSEAQQGCPVTFTYTFDEIYNLLNEFNVIKIWKDHIFIWDIPSYKAYKYVVAKEWQDVDKNTINEYSKELGWHTMVIARKKSS